jgi:hypothetical protein
MSAKTIVFNKVERYLKEIFPAAEQKSETQFSVPFESTRIWVSIEDGNIPKSEKVKAWHLKHDIPHVLVKVWATILIGAPRSPGLFKWVATEGQDWMLGGTQVVLGDDGNCSLLFVYSLAGETLDPGEFKNAVMSVATAANHLDDIAQEKFGGKRFIDLKVEDLNELR